MKISPIKINPYKQNFTSTSKTAYQKQDGTRYVSPVYNIEGEDKVACSNRTYIFRKDLPWSTLPSYLAKEIGRNSKINVYNFACSDGSETYSFIMSAIERYGEKDAARFFPIIASDIDSYMINQAKSGILPANYDDLDEIERTLGGGLDKVAKYFYVEPNRKDRQYPLILHPKKILSDNVVFKNQDIEDGLDEIKGTDSVVMARNFWRYLPADKLARTSLKLRRNMTPSSRLVIGEFDHKNFYGNLLEYGFSIPSFLQKLGFCPCNNTPYDIYTNILKINEHGGLDFVLDENLWLEEVRLLHPGYKLGYGAY